MIFQSPHAGLVVHIRDETRFTDPITGFRELDRKSVVADFLDSSTVGALRDAEGGVIRDEEGVEMLDIRGGCFDTDEAAVRLGWTEEEKAYAEAKLLSLAQNPREPITLWEPPAPECPLPGWEKLSPARILSISAELGVVAEALAYERVTENRAELTAMLEKKLGQAQHDRAVDDALTAA